MAKKHFLDAILLTLGVSVLLGLGFAMMDALRQDAEDFVYGCIREETLVSFQPVSNSTGRITSYAYTTANNTIYESQKQFPLNVRVCVQEGSMQVDKN